jgi:hypothetical protein
VTPLPTAPPRPRAYQGEIVFAETEAVAWLRRAGPVARRMNEESRHDPIEGETT